MQRHVTRGLASAWIRMIMEESAARIRIQYADPDPATN